MATVSVRKFVLSLDQVELVDFAMPLDEIGRTLAGLGFEAAGTYAFRFSDPECVVKVDLTRSPDGFYVTAYVQALDGHEYRVRELAEAFGAHLLDGSRRPGD